MSKQKKAGPATAGADPAAELDILHPERTGMIGGKKVTVREYGFVEGMRLRPLMKPFLDDLHESMRDGQPLRFELALDVMARHVDAVVELAAIAADADPAWAASLAPDDGHHLLMLWWGANCVFFLRRVGERIAVELQEAQYAASAGEKSTPPSSPTATTAPGSDSTPNAS